MSASFLAGIVILPAAPTFASPVVRIDVSRSVATRVSLPSAAVMSRLERIGSVLLAGTALTTVCNSC
jgi:hypothetical protein